MSIEDHIRKNNLFLGLDSLKINCLSTIAILRKYEKGTVIFSQGQEAAGFYIMVEGRVKIYKLSGEGKEYILHIAEKGDTIAETAVFSGKDYPAYAEAITSCTLLFFPKARFLNIIKDYPEVWMRILETVSKRQRKFADIIEDLSLKGVLERLAKYILHLADEKGKDTFLLDIQKSELALKLGTIPATLSRNLAKLKEKRIISLKKNTVTILNKDALKKLIM